MLRARLADGVKVNILLVTSCVIVPVTPGATVKVWAVMVVGSIVATGAGLRVALQMTCAVRDPEYTDVGHEFPYLKAAE